MSSNPLIFCTRANANVRNFSNYYKICIIHYELIRTFAPANKNSKRINNSLTTKNLRLCLKLNQE